MATAIRGAWLAVSEPADFDGQTYGDCEGRFGSIAELAQLMLDADGAAIVLDRRDVSVSFRAMHRMRAGHDLGRMADPLFVRARGYRAYAAVPVRNAAGEQIGRLAVFGQSVRDFSDRELMLLRKCADLVADQQG